MSGRPAVVSKGKREGGQGWKSCSGGRCMVDSPGPCGDMGSILGAKLLVGGEIRKTG